MSYAHSRVATKAKRRLTALTAKPANDTLPAFIPRVSPDRFSPDHLAPIIRLFERIARGERVRACISVPPQHGKTELVLHGLAWLLSQHASWRLAYGTYQQDQSDDKSHTARAIAQRAGVPLSPDRKNLRMWRTPGGGGCLFTSVDGPGTGQPARVFVVDDPYKGRSEAMSETVRTHVVRWFTSVVLQRGQEDMCVLVVHTRWVEDDLIGEIAAGKFGAVSTAEGDGGWEIINLPMLADNDNQPSERPYDTAVRVLNPLRVLPNGDTFGWTLEGARRQLRDTPEEEAEALGQGKPRQRKEGALWQWDWIQTGRVPVAPPLRRIVVAVDPPATSGPTAAEAGILAAGIGYDGRGYVLRDVSAKLKPGDWAERAVLLFDELEADAIVAEVNNGGEMVQHTITVAAEVLFRKGFRKSPKINVEIVHASRGKAVRAEPIATLYRGGMVSHVGAYPTLEKQLTSWDPATSTTSPDRLDALVWALWALQIEAAAEAAESWTEPYQD